MRNISYDFNNLTKRIDDAIESLLNQLSLKQQEILRLKNENEELRNSFNEILKEIKGYNIQLEQIKSHYVNNNHKFK